MEITLDRTKKDTVITVMKFLFLLSNSDVELPFQWMIYKPDMTDVDELDKKPDRVPDVDSVFSVHPPSGMLPPAKEMEFKITFAPPVVSYLQCTLKDGLIRGS